MEGLAVYAGHERRRTALRYMRSQLEKRINLDMIWCAVILVGAGLCLGSGIGSGTLINSFVNNASGLSLTQEEFWTFTIIFQVKCLVYGKFNVLRNIIYIQVIILLRL